MRLSGLILSAAITLISVLTGQAQPVVKANNTDALNLTTSWVLGAVPTSSDVAQWDSTVTSANATSLGADTSWGGILVTNPGGTVTINAGINTLTLGSSGIDMSGATRDLVLSNTNILGADQTWNVISGRTLTVAAGLGGSGLLTKSGAGGLTLSAGNVNSGGLSVTAGSVTCANSGSSTAIYGTGTLSLSGGSTLRLSSSSVVTINNALVIDTAGGIMSFKAGAFNPPSLSGSGPLTIQVDSGSTFTPTTFQNWSGNINFRAASGTGFLRLASGFVDSLGNAALDLGAGCQLNRQNGTSGTTAGNIGTLSGAVGSSVGGSAAGGGTFVYSVGSRNEDSTFAGNIVNGGTKTGITKVGTGTWYLSGTNSYSGATLVSAGKLVGVTGGSISNTVSFTVADGATNGVKVVSANGQWTTTNLIYNAGATCLELNLGGTPSTNTAPLNVLGALTADSTVSVVVYAGNVTAGTTYPLVKYGSLGGTGYAAFSLAVTGPHFTGHLVDNSGSQRIDLVVDTVTQPIRWGAGSGDWDINATANWVDAASASTTYQEMGGFGDVTIFEDAASGTAPITVNFPATVSPASVTVSNDVKDYTFSGTGQISGAAALSKLGTNTLTMSLTNSFTGGSTLGGGTVTLATTGAGGTGLGSGSVVLTNTATLVLYSGDGGDPGAANAATFANPLNVPTGQAGAVWNASRGALTGPLTGGGTLNFRVNGIRGDVSANWSAFTGQINVTARNGSGDEFRIANFQAAGYGKLNIGDNVNFHQIFNPPSGSGTQTIQPIGELSGPSLARLGGNPVSGRFVNWTVGALNTSSTFAGTIADDTGAARLTKVGTGTLTLTGTSTYTGHTSVSNGTLEVNGAINSSPVTNYAGSTLAGIGTLGGDASLQAGSTVSPALNDYGTLTFNNLTFNGGTNRVNISITNSDLLVVGGGLNLAALSPVVLNISGTLTNGTYKLVQYGFLSGGSVASLALSGFSQAGQTASLVDAGTEIDLVVAPVGSSSLIWASAGAANNWWDVATSINWSNGPALSVFANGDTVTFNDSGAANSPVDLRQPVQPVAVVVTGTQNYIFDSGNGAGKISGLSTRLTKSGSGTLTINTPNDNGGSITISGGTLEVGNGGNTASIGTGVITNNAALVFAQTNDVTLNNITGSGSLTKNGSGTVTLGGSYNYTGATVIGAGATLQVGTGGATGPLGSGPVTLDGTLIMNQSGTVVLTNNLSGGGNFVKAGTSTLTASGNNTYFGNTYVNNGVLVLPGSERIPDGGSTTGWLILDGGASTAGTLDLSGFNESVNALSGLSGTVLGVITNTTASGTNTLTVGNDTADTSYSGMINENPTGAKISLVKRGAAEQKLAAGNAYSAGTLVNGGKLTLRNGLAAGSGSITLADGATLNMTNTPGNNSIFVGNDIITLPGATATTASDALGCGYSGLFFGSANSTNNVTGSVSISTAGVKQFQSFTGTVHVVTGTQLRFSSTTLSINGGDNALFTVDGTINTRNGNTGGSGISLGALSGTGYLSGAGNAAGSTVYTLGAKGLNSTFDGYIENGGFGNTTIIKTGAGTQTLDGGLTYSGNTTISNGVLALSGATAELTNTPVISVKSGATLDVSGTTSGTLTLGALKAQTLSGSGTVIGPVVANGAFAASIIPGDSIGTLAMPSGLTLAANSLVTMELNRTNAGASNDVITASVAADGTLTVTNIGPALHTGDKFKLFSVPISGAFTATNLPQTFVDANLAVQNYVWTNKLALDGSIEVLSGFVPASPVATNATNITFSSGGGSLTVGWPSDHTGWTLQTQTNARSVGLGNSWFDVSGSTTTNLMVFPTSPADPTVFFRLYYVIP